MRIVSLAPSVTEILFALGIDNDLVGVTKYCDYPEAAKSKPIMGGWVDIDFDKVLAAKPDIVFTSTVVQQKVHEKAKSLGLNVVHIDPRTLNQVLESIVFTGSLVGKKIEAEALLGQLNSEFEKIKKESKTKIYVEEWPVMVSCNWVPDVIETVGGISLGKSGELSHEITTEDVKKFDPDIIVMSWCGFGTRDIKHKLTERPGWSELRAVKSDKVFVLDDSLLNRPGPRLVDGAKSLLTLIQKL